MHGVGKVAPGVAWVQRAGGAALVPGARVWFCNRLTGEPPEGGGGRLPEGDGPAQEGRKAEQRPDGGVPRPQPQPVERHGAN
ncbi:hypothetical protein chiPu_0027802 [Chiloscyllium punctatum]|uniref:Uncharacterized protein n=1 Tax=Chiloscyllium punctatum TaxID=137246 RepID=A0A401TMD7_CHIPU|nr:hypothetical protein [Chiloscyllium punctatum]